MINITEIAQHAIAFLNIKDIKDVRFRIRSNEIDNSWRLVVRRKDDKTGQNECLLGVSPELAELQIAMAEIIKYINHYFGKDSNPRPSNMTTTMTPL